MSYSFPTIPDFKAQFMRDFPYAVPASGGGEGASATAGLSGTSVASVTLDSGGSGYPRVPGVIIYGGGGSGARATATIAAQAVTGFTVVSAGIGYSQSPTVYISNGTGDNTDYTKVTDYDIVNGFTQATSFNFSEALYGSQAAFTTGANLLSAHYMVLSLQAGNSGMNGQATWITQAKSVGNVQEAYQIPDRVLMSPILAKLSKTVYGAQFLELIAPRLIANVQSYWGGTRA